MRKYQIIMLAIASLFVFVGITDTVYAKAEVELRFNYSMPPKLSPADSWEWFGAELEKRSRGRVKITFFPQNALFKPQMAVENIITGTADISNISLAFETERMPYTSVLRMPTVIWPGTIKGGVAGANALLRLHEEFPEIQKEFQNVKLLFVALLSPYNLLTKKPVRVPADLNGMKIGASGSQRTFVNLQGGAAVGVIPPQSYLSLKTGVVDGMCSNWNIIGSYKLWEVAKYFTDFDLGRIAMPIIMNKESWNRLPADIQKLMTAVGAEATEKGIQSMYESGEKGRKLAEGQIEVITPNKEELAAWMKAVQPLEDEWLEKMDKGGYGAARKILNRYKALNADISK
jgi:TRAP-type C4-dicarboxylate transport system substrate-binding protein